MAKKDQTLKIKRTLDDVLGIAANYRPVGKKKTTVARKEKKAGKGRNRVKRKKDATKD